MCIRRVVTGLAALGCVAALAGCFAHSEPEVPASWLRASRPDGPNADGYGAWIGMYTGWRRGSHVTGELIACDRDSIWVLTTGGLLAFTARQVRAMTVYTGLGPEGEVKTLSLSNARAAELRPWTRFPQGIPAGLDRALILPRPWLEQ